jgi:hypothetical protein
MAHGVAQSTSAITELAESQANDSIIREIAGHVSPRMLALYSHVRMETKRKALDALSGGRLKGGYGTNNDTNSLAQPITQPQVIEKNGGADGIRTHDLLDAIEARSQLRHGPTVSFSVYHNRVQRHLRTNSPQQLPPALEPQCRRPTREFPAA